MKKLEFVLIELVLACKDSSDLEISRTVKAHLQRVIAESVPGHETLVRASEVAQSFPELSSEVLSKMRETPGEGPPYYKLSARRIRYSLSDIAAWKASKRRD